MRKIIRPDPRSSVARRLGVLVGVQTDGLAILLVLVLVIAGFALSDTRVIARDTGSVGTRRCPLLPGAADTPGGLRRRIWISLPGRLVADECLYTGRCPWPSTGAVNGVNHVSPVKNQRIKLLRLAALGNVESRELIYGAASLPDYAERHVRDCSWDALGPRKRLGPQ